MQDHNPIPENEKPDCPLIRQDGNIFNLIGIASRTLKQNGMAEQAKEMANRIYACGSYGEALCIIGEYVNITSIHDEPQQRSSVREHLRETKSSDPVGTPKPGKGQER